MKNNFYFKLGIIFLLIIALLIPKSFLSNIINERLGWREQTYISIGQSWPGEQTLAGPVLVVPYQLTYSIKEKIETKGHLLKDIIKEATYEDNLYLIPKKLTITSQLDSSMRHRGIYGIPVYSNAMAVKGEFNFQAMVELLEHNKGKKILWGKPHLSVLVTDQRGIAAPPSLKWDNESIAFQPGSYLPGTESGMSALLPAIDLAKTRTATFAFDMQLKGMRSVNFALLSDDTIIQLSSNWPSPSFTGQLLPDKHTITEQGFTAQWRASSFSYNISGVMAACRKGECLRLMEKTVGFGLIQPVDVYQQSERSVKYAGLFITLTFVVLILLEVLKKLRIHPIQYTLVGMALLVFYLLLISLSEQVSFLLAYCCGALGCTVLLTLYFGAILHSNRLGLVLGAGLSVLYAVLYIILQAEETALLMGSLLIFVVLAVLMLLTRHLDWYALARQNETPLQESK